MMIVILAKEYSRYGKYIKLLQRIKKGPEGLILRGLLMTISRLEGVAGCTGVIFLHMFFMDFLRVILIFIFMTA